MCKIEVRLFFYYINSDGMEVWNKCTYYIYDPIKTLIKIGESEFFDRAMHIKPESQTIYTVLSAHVMRIVIEIILLLHFISIFVSSFYMEQVKWEFIVPIFIFLIILKRFLIYLTAVLILVFIFLDWKIGV